MADEPTDDIVSSETREEEEREAKDEIDPGRGPTPEEETAAERSAPASDETRAGYEDMLDKGANAKGEGRTP